MLLFRASFAALVTAALIVALGVVPAHASHLHRSHATSRTHHARRTTHHYRRRTTHHYYHRYRRVRRQQSIQPARVKQIQKALIRVHYLDGKPNGRWDAKTIDAMRKYQAHNGWQTKLTPDSRALEKLGLGPDYSNALNAKDLSLASPTAGAPIPADQEAGFAAAAGISQ